MKICSRCGEDKLRADFPKNGGTLCKPCKNAKARETYAEDLELSRAKKRAEAKKSYKTEQRKEKARRYRRKYPEKVKADNEKRRDYRNEWRKGWLKTKPGYMLHYNNLRRKAERRATPLWVKSDKDHLEQIAAIYRSAKVRSIFHEEPYQVDHIEPLRGKTSSGLHVVWNLQVLHATENNKKGNKLIVQPT